MTARSAIVGIVALGLTLVATSCRSNDESHENAAPVVKPVGPCRIAFRVRVAGTWSSDGRTIFYSKIIPSLTDNTRPWAMNADGSGKRPLKGHAETGRRSPDGEWIVETRDSGVGQIWVMHRDGTGIRPVARPRGAAVYESRAWSPSCK